MTMVDSEMSSDGYVRIRESALACLQVEHLSSGIDMSILNPMPPGDAVGDSVTGYTEWIGRWRGTEVSIGWDWCIRYGEVVLVNPSEIRTNIQLVSDLGVALTPRQGRAQLAKWIDTFAWREIAVGELRATSS
jgi:hypothetical protein